MSTDPRAAIAAADTALGIEFGSTRIKAVLIGPDHEVLATGGHGWENHLEGGLWSYTLDEVVAGLQSAYASLVADVRERYDVTPTSYGSIGISAMMHGYLAFDAEGNLLAPFRTWRNTNTGRAADELTRLFGFNIPLRWSIAHLHQAVLDSEEHAPRVARLTTLAGWVHYQLTGRHVLGVGDASGMFPIDSEAGTYVESYLDQYEALVAERVPWRLRDVLPTVLSAGEDAGGVMAYNTLSAEPLVGQEAAQPVFTHTADARVTLANAVRAQLMSIFAAVRIGVDILSAEGVRLDSLFAHGGLFKTPGVAQQILADSLNIPVSVGDTAGEGGAWGIAVLARYRAVLAGDEAAPALPEYLSDRVFAGASVSTLEPTPEGVAGYERFLDAYRAALPGVEVIARGTAS